VKKCDDNRESLIFLRKKIFKKKNSKLNFFHQWLTVVLKSDKEIIENTHKKPSKTTKR